MWIIAIWWTMLVVWLNADHEYARARQWERAHGIAHLTPPTLARTRKE